MTSDDASAEADDAREDRSRRNGYLDEQEEESFPASDPHSDWAGPGPTVEGD